MIVVVGRPRLDDGGGPGGLAALIALAAVRAGGRAELIGRVSDDADGDQAIVELGRMGIGHAAVLRDPLDSTRQIEAADVELALRYITECNVLVVAEPLPGDALRAVVDGAAYHGAALVVVTTGEADPSEALPAHATVLAAPDEGQAPFAEVVGRYAARLASGAEPAAAWRAAVDGSGWEPAGDA